MSRNFTSYFIWRCAATKSHNIENYQWSFHLQNVVAKQRWKSAFRWFCFVFLCKTGPKGVSTIPYHPNTTLSPVSPDAAEPTAQQQPVGNLPQLTADPPGPPLLVGTRSSNCYWPRLPAAMTTGCGPSPTTIFAPVSKPYLPGTNPMLHLNSSQTRSTT